MKIQYTNKPVFLLISILLFFSATSFAQLRLQDSLIAYLPLNGNGLDLSGNNNHSSVSATGAYATSNQAGVAGSAFFFNGALEQGQLDFGTSLLNNNPNFSMSFWFNPSSLSNGMSMVGQDNLLEVGFFTSPTRLTFFHPTSGSFSSNLTSGAGVWQHVVVMCSPQNIRVFINGIQTNSVNGNFSLGATSFTTRIGGNVLNQSNNSWFRGAIDEVRFYNRILSNDEIQLLSSSGSHSMVVGSFSNQWCVGQTVQVPFATLGIFDSSNVFTLQLSDDQGSFGNNPLQLQTLSAMQSDTFSFTVPAHLLTSGQYRLRIISSFPLRVGTASSQSATVTNAAQTINRLNQDRMVWYRFNANTADSSGNSMHASAQGGTSYTTDRHGNAFSAIELNGTSGFVQVPAGVWFSGSYTVSCWVRPNTITNWARLYDFGNGSANDNVLATLFESNNNRQQAENYIATSSPGFARTQLPGLRMGQWNHYLVQYDGTVLRIYINGWLAASENLPNPRFITRNNCFIGRSNWSSDAFANAAFDDFMIYNRALSVNEIMALANDGGIYTNGTPCAGNTLQLRAPNIQGATYAWSGPAGFSSTLPIVEIDSVSAANNGTYQLVLKLNACDSAVFSRNITIPSATGLPAVTFTSLPAVLNTGSANVSLTATPTGGVFTGNGVSGNIFSPSLVNVGVHRIGYSVAHSTGCLATHFAQTEIFQGYNMQSATVQACNGGFYDQGGSTANYLPNQNIVQTFCSGDTINRMRFHFTNFGFGSGDTLFVYDGSDTNSFMIAYYIQNSISDVVWSSGSCITFQFKSDATNHGSGWLCTFTCTSSPEILNEAITMRAGMHQTCSAILREPGGTGNYSHGFWVQTFRASPGARLRFNRTMMNINGNNGGHWLRIFDGPTSAFPLISQSNNFNWNNPIAESTGEYLTFVFDANNTNAGTNLAGFEGTLECFGAMLPTYVIGQGIVQACEGMFVDDGGLGANYSNNANLIQTFKTESVGKKLRITFNQNEARLNTGDTLFVFDGPDTNAQRLAAFIQGSRFEPMKSKDSSLTFRFTSNATGTDRGWQAFLNCVTTHPLRDTFNLSSGIRYTDSAIVFDPGGTGNYSLGFWRQTFGSYSGNRLRLNFTELNVNGNNDGHWVRIYDGPNQTFPLIGSFNEWAWPQGIIESSGRYITIEFDANNNMAGTRPGFTINMFSTSEVLPVLLMDTVNVQSCSGVFYDNGGPNANYSDNYTAVKTICADSGNLLRLNFNHVNTQFSAGDSLFVFDGIDTSALPLAVIIQGTRIEPLFAQGQCLTFFFKSNATGNGRGWQGFITCDTVPKPQEAFALSAGVRYVCDAIVRDPGGTGNYPRGFWRQTFGSHNGNKLLLNFTELNVNGNNDGHWVRVYDGPDHTFPLIGSFNEWAWPSGPIESTGRFITIEFDANNTMASTRPGFTASLTCTDPLPLQINMANSKVQTCNAVFYDDAGPNSNYSNNANLVQTICADSAQMLRVRFNHVTTQFGSGDSLFVYDGDTINNKLIAVFVQGSRMEPLFAQNQCLTFYFKSNATGNGRGWQGFVTCDTISKPQETIFLSAGVRYVCDATLLDPGGTGNYPRGFWRQTFGSIDSTRLLMTFSELNVNGNNDGHWVTVYDGPNQTFPVIGSYNEWAWPQIEIRSSGRYLTVEFNSNNTLASTRPGFTANLACTDALPLPINISSQSVQTCNAVYHDSNGPNANYPNNQYVAQTICGDTGRLLSISFRQNASRLASGDTLIVYDGPDTLSQRLAVYHAGSRFDDLKSTGQCYTFVFKSDATNNDMGWQGFITCDTIPRGVEVINLNRGTRYTCNAIIRDNGGTGNYPRGTDALFVQTFGSYNGNRLQLSFTEFNINSSNSVHWLRIYDGPNTSFPLIGSYNNSTGSPGIISSSGRYLTIEMDTRNTGAAAAAGFTAQLNCITPILPQILMTNAMRSSTCEAVFYDNGGANGNYLPNTNSVHTITSANNQLLQISFNRANTEFASGDTLFIFDGDSVTSPLLGVFISGSILETVTSSNSSLTFRFVSDATNQGRGWQAFVSCINAPPSTTTYVMSSGSRNTCNAVFLDPGGTANYPQGTWIQTFRSYNGQRLRAVRQSFSISTGAGGHWLDVYDGTSINAPLIGSYNNSNPPPVAFQSTSDALTFRLRATAATATAAGWEYRLSCFSGNTIDVDWITSPICRQRSFAVPFTRFVSVDTNNVYTAQLSDSLGNFGSPINIGSLVSSDSTGVITASIPSSVLAGNGYRIRVVSSHPVVLGNASPNAITVLANPLQPSITNSGASAFCNGIGNTTLSIINQAGMNYRWTRNDTTVGANATALSVSQTGNYRIEIFNGCDTILSTQSVTIQHITAPLPQTITANGDTNICSNANVQLSVPAQTGVNYQWYRNDTVPVGGNNRIYTASQAGTYRVGLSNSCGTSNSINQVNVNIVATPPAVPTVSFTGSLNICNGDSVLLSTTPQSNVAYQWRRNGSPIGTDTNVLVAQTVGTYTVSVTNQCSTINSSNSRIVTILSPTIIHSIIAPDTLCPGSNKTVSVSASGAGTLQYQWYRNGDSLPGRTTASFQITGFSLIDTGYYYVKVIGQCGTQFSDSTYLSWRKPGVWVGGVNNSWTNTANWNCPLVPDSSTDVYVSASALFMPFVLGHREVRNLHIETGTFVNITDTFSSLNVLGQITGGGRFNHTAGTLALTGNQMQQLPGGTYHSLRINNSAGISLGGHIRINDTLRLQSGMIWAGSNLITLGSATAAFSGYSNNRYVQTSSAGGVVITQSGVGGRTQPITIPIGSSTYNPVLFANIGVLDTFTIKVLDTVYSSYIGTQPNGTALSNGVVNRTWIVEETVAGGSNITLGVYWSDTNETSGFSRNTSYLAFYNGSTWIPFSSAPPTGTTLYNHTQTGITQLNMPFGVGSGSVLPVSLLDFTANRITQKAVGLTWRTAIEINNSYFDLERSTDMLNFERVARVGAVSPAGALYQYTDKLPVSLHRNATLYYRLSQTDYDGTRTILGIRAVDAHTSQANVLIALKPNPFSDIVQIDIQDATESLSINVYNAVGKLVYQSQTQPGQSTHRIATEQWTEGMYIIQVGNHTQKVIKTNND
jgi:hypothetical protein